MHKIKTSLALIQPLLPPHVLTYVCYFNYHTILIRLLSPPIKSADVHNVFVLKSNHLWGLSATGARTQRPIEKYLGVSILHLVNIVKEIYSLFSLIFNNFLHNVRILLVVFISSFTWIGLQQFSFRACLFYPFKLYIRSPIFFYPQGHNCRLIVENSCYYSIISTSV